MDDRSTEGTTEIAVVCLFVFCLSVHNTPETGRNQLIELVVNFHQLLHKTFIKIGETVRGSSKPAQGRAGALNKGKFPTCVRFRRGLLLVHRVNDGISNFTDVILDRLGDGLEAVGHVVVEVEHPRQVRRGILLQHHLALLLSPIGVETRDLRVASGGTHFKREGVLYPSVFLAQNVFLVLDQHCLP